MLTLFSSSAGKFDLQQTRDGLSPTRDDSSITDKELEKQRRKLDKELKQRQKDAERRKMKDEKRRIKEAEKLEKEQAKKQAKTKMKANSVQSQLTMEDFRASADNPIPIFLEKAIAFIEKEGLDAEGLYRVPGNRAHVDILFQKFDEGNLGLFSLARHHRAEHVNSTSDHNVNIADLDIAVNAVATAVKDFFFKRLPPIMGPEHMSELESISSKVYSGMKSRPTV